MPKSRETDLALFSNGKMEISTTFDSIKLETTLVMYFNVFSYPYPNNAVSPNLTRLLDLSLFIIRTFICYLPFLVRKIFAVGLKNNHRASCKF